MSNEPHIIVRFEQLKRLSEKLSRISAVLETHSVEGRTEARIYRSFQADCDSLLRNGFGQDELNQLSAEIMRHLEGNKDGGYYPVTYDKETSRWQRLPDDQVRALEEAIDGSYELALSLRVVEDLT